ncbi:hypothetical protein [Limibacterium fermenti]|uniref:pPIWI-associating nuclease domain-containing protein n=1 Tax=Limibacterium fermenti TaxID=3229863 RepID=UPI003A67282D
MTKYEKNKKVIEKLLKTKFQKALLEAVIDNLSDDSKALCFNNFAYSMRELMIDFLKSLAPDDEIIKCDWYNAKDAYIKNKVSDKTEPSRKQRIKYIVQGPLTDNFVDINIIPLSDIEDIQTEFLSSFSLLNKYTHITDKTLGLKDKDRENKAQEIFQTFINLVWLLNKYKTKLFNDTEKIITDEVYETVIYEAINEINCLSTYQYLENVNVDKISIQKIEKDQITTHINGTIDVNLQYGSSGDLRRGDGWVNEENFPFTCTAYVHLGISDFSDIIIENVEIDTDDFYGISEISDEELERMIDKELDSSES